MQETIEKAGADRMSAPALFCLEISGFGNVIEASPLP